MVASLRVPGRGSPLPGPGCYANSSSRPLFVKRGSAFMLREDRTASLPHADASFAATQRCACPLAPGQVELRETAVPPPGPGQVLLRIERAMAGGTDRKAFQRGHPQIPMPGPFGHRYAGLVVALGDGAPAFEEGQPVMGVHSAPCGECELCRKGRWQLCPDV